VGFFFRMGGGRRGVDLASSLSGGAVCGCLGRGGYGVWWGSGSVAGGGFNAGGRGVGRGVFWVLGGCGVGGLCCRAVGSSFGRDAAGGLLCQLFIGCRAEGWLGGGLWL